MIAEVYNAFIQAKCPKDIAEKAAIAISSETKRESETIKISYLQQATKSKISDKELLLVLLVGEFFTICKK